MQRDFPLFTIDEPHSRDLDDAIGLARTTSGWTVRVAIANPSVHVALGSTIDRDARQQGASIYQGRRGVRPMLPASISESKSTLTAGQPRSAMLIDLSIDQAGCLAGTSVTAGEITVARRLAYSDVSQIAENKSDELHSSIVDAIAIAKGLLKQRRERGALAVYDARRSLLTDEEGRVRHHDASEMIGHILVQEFMVAANASVAEYAARLDVPFLFRSHEPRVSAPRGPAAAESFEAWITAGHASTAAAAERLSVVAHRARYTATLTGHYGLNLPAYAHVTSPLRRYADLVNQRQLLAFVAGLPLPYTQEALTEIGNELFEAQRNAEEARSEYWKTPVIAAARAAVDANAQDQLRALADNEMGQAVKAGIVGGFAPALTAEVIRRLNEGILSDKVALRLLEGRATLPSELSRAFATMLAAKPFLTISYMHHAVAVGEVAHLDVQFDETEKASSGGPSFFARVSFSDVKRGLTLSAEARHPRKKDAEQQAMLLALCDFLGVERIYTSFERPEPMARPSLKAAHQKTTEPSITNPKGALLELCQKLKLPAPTFTSTSNGPSHAPTFKCTAGLDADGRSLCATSPAAGSKKLAEALAADALLLQLREHPDQAAGSGETAHPLSASSNLAPPASTEALGRAVMRLQEYTQKARKPPPSYDFIEVSKTPSSFECRVHVAGAAAQIEFRAAGPTKQGAKGMAALGALAALGISS